MVRHIVFWKFKDTITGPARDEALRRIKEGFEAMNGQIAGLRHIEVGIAFSTGPESADFSLYSEFDSRAALEGYNTHALHVAMVAIVREVRSERRVSDYEV
jgi:stress responsive alpha/beta barrel protein